MERHYLLALSLATFASAVSAQAPCLRWSEGFGVRGADGSVNSSLVWDDGTGPALYIGGPFGSVAQTKARGVARFDGEAWHALGAGIPGNVDALIEFDHGTGSALYAGGSFTSAGGLPASKIARWDGASWSDLGGGLTGSRVYALAVYDDGGGPALYAGGSFTAAGGASASNVARWDGSSWSAVGGGADGEVRALAVFDDGGGPALYAGGRFASAGGLLVNCIARWDGGAWSALAGGVWVSSYGGVNALCVFDDGAGEALFAGGSFRIGTAIDDIARWDGTAWSSWGGASSIGEIAALTEFDDGSGAALYAGWAYTLVRLDAAASVPLGFPVAASSGSPAVRTLCAVPAGPASAAALFVGGQFRSNDASLASNCLLWQSGAWRGFGAEQMGPLGWGASACAVYDDGSGPALYVNGCFPLANGRSTRGVARWDGARWRAVPRPSRAFYLDSPTDLCAHAGGGGLSSGLYAIGPSHLYRFDGVTWHDLGTVPGTWDASPRCLALFDDGTRTRLLVGGDLGTPMSQWGLVAWDDAGWSWLGGGVNGVVDCMKVFDAGAGPQLFVGGQFNWGGGQPINSIARWNGTEFEPVGSATPGGGVDATVSALEVFDDGSGPALYVGGPFSHADGVPARGIARWDGASWSSVAGGTDGAVSGLGSFDDGTGEVLVALGGFSDAGGVPVENAASWNGAQWSEFGGGTGTGPTSSLQLLQHDDGSGPALWIVGQIDWAGDLGANGLARWSNDCCCAPATYCTAKPNSLGCLPAIGSSGVSSFTDGVPFLITAADIPNPSMGLLFYGLSGPAAIPFQGGVQCVRAPVRRTSLQASGTNSGPPDCSGNLGIDFDARVASGIDPSLVAGVQVHAQYWYRDASSPGGTGLTDAVGFAVCP